MIVWIFAVNSFDEDIQYRKGIGTDTTHFRVGTQGMTHSTRWAAVWAIRRPAHDGQNPRRLQLKGSSSSLWHVSQPSRRKPWARMPHYKASTQHGEITRDVDLLGIDPISTQNPTPS